MNDLESWKTISGLVGLEQAQRVSLVSENDEEPYIVWLGHASFLLCWHGQKLLVDPVFKKWIGFYKRYVPVSDLSSVRKIDAILVTHAHMDHLDTRWIEASNFETVVVPRKTEQFFGRKKRERIVSLRVGEKTKLGNLRVTATYAKHGGWRYPWQRGYVACGYLVSDGDRTVFFCGDSASGSHFDKIGKQTKIDIAVLPIGAYSPKWFLGKRHLNPPEAVGAAKALKAKQVIPFHFGSYRLSLEPLNEPVQWFAKVAFEQGVGWRLPYCF